MLKTITILRERVRNPDEYPFNVPVIRSLAELRIKSRVSFFVGENGTGKSTLLEAIASHYGFGREGGNRNFTNDSSESNRSAEPLARALRLSFDLRSGAGFFLRAESFFNVATWIDALDKEPAFAPPLSDSYGGQSLHTRSHGETFLTLLDAKFRRNGLFLLDEPEAALSPQRQLDTRMRNSLSRAIPRSCLVTQGHRYFLLTGLESRRLNTSNSLTCRSFGAF